MKNDFLLSQAFRLIIKVLPRNLKVRAILNLFYIFLNSLIELIGIAFLIPLLVVILDESKIKTNTWLNSIYKALDFGSSTHFIIFLSVLILLLTILKNIGSIILLRNQYRFSFSIYKYISLALFNYYYDIGLQYLKSQNSNKIVNHITTVTLMFTQNVINSVFGIINESIVFILFIAGLIIYDPSVIVILIISTVPFIYIFFKLLKKRIEAIGKERNQVMIDQNKILYETFQGYVDIEIRNKKKWVFSKFSTLLQYMNHLQIQNATFLRLPLKFIEIIIVMALVTIICFGIWLNRSLESIGVLLGIVAIAAYRLLPGINRLMNFSLTLRNHTYTFDVINLIIGTKSKRNNFMASENANTEEIKFLHKIKLDKICFSFQQNNPTLNDVSLTIKKGDIVGIIGESGSGKTTFLNILLRFYKETAGEILVDERRLEEKDIVPWRKLIGYVPQDVFIFDGSFKENITLGDGPEEIDEAKLMKAITNANLSGLIKTLDRGLDSNIGERGAKLSGGQKQRLGIARALYKGAEILLFDEATSSLDAQMEEDVNSSIKELSLINNELTIMIIAHRYTSLKHCNRIIELNKGTIYKEWSYQELVEQFGN